VYRGDEAVEVVPATDDPVGIRSRALELITAA
jgi:hypothetical protein